MPAQFDPYHRWLGIPAHEQPANHYRLLGINVFESDPNVIEAAADRQMGHLRSYQASQHSALSQELLNEVAAARVCLLDPTRKAEYDQSLRAQLERESVAERSTPAVQISTSPQMLSRKRAAWPIAVGLGAVAVAVLLTLFLWPMSSDEPVQVVVAPESEPDNSVPLASPAEPSETADARAVSEKQRAEAGPAEGPEPTRPDSSPVAEAVMTGVGTESTTPATVLPDETPAGNSDEQQRAIPEPSVRLPIPAQARQKQIVGQLEEAYGLSKVESPEDQLRLAAELLGAKSDDADTRFTLRRKAMELASAGGDAAMMLRAAGAIAAEFDVDSLSVRANILNSFGEGARTESRVKSLVESIEPVIDEALETDRCDIALELASTAYEMCLGSAGEEYRKAVYERRKEVQEFHEQWKACQEALTELAAAPSNAEAHLAVGVYWCFTRGDWQQGLPHLVQGSDEPLKVLADRDLQTPEDPDEQLALGDAWWDQSAIQDGIAATACLARAAHWYREALPRLAGLPKLKAERRLEEFAGQKQEDGSVSEKTEGSPRTREEHAQSPEERLRQFTEALRNARPVNLGPDINTNKYDSGPALSADGCTLVFHSNRPGGLGESDLWMSVRDTKDDPFGSPVNLGPGVNTGGSERSPVLSANGRLLLFDSDRPGGIGKVDLWMCGRQSPHEPFGTPVNLGRAANSKEWDFGSVLSTDGMTLLFASFRPGGLGGSDLWMCVRKSAKQPFGLPINMNSPVNTKASEGSPTLSSDGLWLLFHTSRPGGSGKTDLWMSARASKSESFGSPFNLGPTINSREDDYTPALSSDGRLLLFSTDRPGGQGDRDLWMVELELPPTEE